MQINHTRLTDTVTAINTQFLFGTRLFPTHVFVLETDNGLVLFDTGGPGSGQLIVASMKAAGYDPGALRAICLSHWHKDHTGGLAELVKLLAPDAPIDIFIGTVDLALMKKQQVQVLRLHPFARLPILHRPGKLPVPDQARLIALDKTGEHQLQKAYAVRPIATPGHTPGHTAYLHEPTESLFSGCALSLIRPDTVGLVPIFYDRALQVRSGRYLAKLDFNYLFPVHLFLRSDTIPLNNRRPCKGKPGWLNKLMGDRLFFKYDN
jgi:glyoxylase-like metal-dependent hydrolase (beta-lactamase superfamily II)